MPALSLLLVLLVAEPDLNLADYYGFAPVEVFDADNRLFRLVSGDFGGRRPARPRRDRQRWLADQTVDSV